MMKKHYERGEMPAEMRKIAPDYERIRAALFGVSVTVIFLVFVADLIFMLSGSPEVTAGEMIIGYSISVGYLMLGKILWKAIPRLDILHHIMTVFPLVVFASVIACIHTSYDAAACGLCVPVIVSIIYYNPFFIEVTGAACMIGAGISAIFLDMAGEQNILSRVLVIIALITVTLFFVLVICKMMNMQKAKMVKIIGEAKQAQMEALAANKAKSQFLANMSHEIRTPINAILGMNEMILREERNPSIREYSSNIYASGSLLLSIINDVLDISKIESGRSEINPVTYDVSSLINDCYNMTAERAKKKKIDLKVECSEELPRLLCGDEAQVRQIIVNLLTNAVKYTDEGSVIFLVFGVFGDTQSDEFTLTVSVKDTGRGISQEDQKKLFERFQRLDLEHNRTIEGTGLGLTIVKHLVEMMNGEITVESELGKGSNFTVKIPQKIIDRTPTGKIEMNYAHNADYEYVRTFEAPDAKILAVDDLPVNLMVITNMLKVLNMHIDTANSGAAALEKMRQTKYDLILMDHMMPEMDGVQTYKTMKADPNTLCRETPVIMLTANALSGVRERYMNEGFTDYLSKPVRGEKLEAMIRTHLPQELIHEIEGGEELSAAEEPPKSKLAPLCEALPEFNLNVALPYCCGDEDFLISVLQDYAASTRYEDMQKMMEEEDFENYRINAHSLKGTSLTIGLCGLSERARASEFALKNNCTELCKTLHADLMEAYKTALDKIREFLKTME